MVRVVKTVAGQFRDTMKDLKCSGVRVCICLVCFSVQNVHVSLKQNKPRKQKVDKKGVLVVILDLEADHSTKMRTNHGESIGIEKGISIELVEENNNNNNNNNNDIGFKSTRRAYDNCQACDKKGVLYPTGIIGDSKIELFVCGDCMDRMQYHHSKKQ